jgi:hypothetical protein
VLGSILEKAFEDSAVGRANQHSQRSVARQTYRLEDAGQYIMNMPFSVDFQFSINQRGR